MRRIIDLISAHFAENNPITVFIKIGKNIAKCSPDTALRDIQDLITKEILRKEATGGRSTNYELNS
jgi:hypothetical protein